jgi:hypothetical protein
MNIIDKLTELEAKATPAKWKNVAGEIGMWRCRPMCPVEVGIIAWVNQPAHPQAVADAELIAATRNALPKLLELYRAAINNSAVREIESDLADAIAALEVEE